MARYPFLAALALAFCTPALAQPGIQRLSGTFATNMPLMLRDGEITAFTATLVPKDGAPCQLSGQLWAYNPPRDYTVDSSDDRELIVVPTGLVVACPNKPVEQVYGNFSITTAARGWTPPQEVVCMGSGRYCPDRRTLVPARTYGQWTTWASVPVAAPTTAASR